VSVHCITLKIFVYSLKIMDEHKPVGIGKYADTTEVKAFTERIREPSDKHQNLATATINGQIRSKKQSSSIVIEIMASLYSSTPALDINLFPYLLMRLTKMEKYAMQVKLGMDDQIISMNGLL
jgi:hypothetical protein